VTELARPTADKAPEDVNSEPTTERAQGSAPIAGAPREPITKFGRLPLFRE
jgi:hypothetical protein